MLHYTTLCYTTLIALHYTTSQYTTLNHYTTLPYPTMFYITLRYTTLITPPQVQLQLCNSTTLQLQLQLHYTTLHPAVVEVTDQVTTASIAATPKNTAPTTFRSISGIALPSVIHNNQSLHKVSYFWNVRHRLARYYWYACLKNVNDNVYVPI